MPTQESDYIKIRKKDVLGFLLIVAVFAAGFLLSDYLKGKQEAVNPQACKQFCDLAGVEFAFTRDNGCYCYQRQVFYDQRRNQTVEMYQAINVGLIKNLTTTQGLTEEAKILMTTK